MMKANELTTEQLREGIYIPSIDGKLIKTWKI